MSHVKTTHLSPISILLSLLLLIGFLNQGCCFNFSFTGFTQNDAANLTRTEQSTISRGALQVTLDTSNTTGLNNMSARVLYNDPVKLWENDRVASFNSTFVLNVVLMPQYELPGEGLAFILTNDTDVPNNSMGQWLGIVNATTNGSQISIIAVEFDTRKSFPEDLDDNHVGLNINSVYSVNQTSLTPSGLNITSGLNLTAMILYDNVTKTLTVSVSQGNFIGAETPILSYTGLDLSRYLPEDVYVGFSASTGSAAVERNCSLEWYFTSDDIGVNSKALTNGGKDSGFANWNWIWISVTAIVVLLLCGVLGGCFYFKSKPKLSDRNLPIIAGVGPKKFKLKELKAATGNFNEKLELGRGAFGVVYKGTLDGQLVAVKRIKNTPKGMQNLIAEVTTIGSLHHKNLVELIGWCYEGSELLLVYEYMHNRSLDTLLYTTDGRLHNETQDTCLSWKKRYNIISGVAQALDYLHNECLKRVLHRDIKASNIMLDSEFNARLGDFGLARMFKLSEMTHYSTNEIAGTPGYMAPELILTGKATTETDVFAFGVLALVVSSGRKPGIQNELAECSHNIVDWVWELQSSGSINKAIDPKLKGDCDETQAKCVLTLGLACCNPNPNLRPSMGYVLQVLIGEASLPVVPSEKPAFVWPPPSPSFTHADSISGAILSTISSIEGR